MSCPKYGYADLSCPLEVAICTWKMRKCWIELKIILFHIFVIWVMADCIYNLRYVISPIYKINRILKTKVAQKKSRDLKNHLSSHKNELQKKIMLGGQSIISQKLKIWNMIFHSFQLIAYLSCEFYQFWSVTYMKSQVCHRKYNQP